MHVSSGSSIATPLGISTTARVRRTLGIACTLALLGAAAACTASDDNTSGSSAGGGGSVADNEVARADGYSSDSASGGGAVAGKPAPAVTTQTQVIRVGDVAVTVKSAANAADSILAIVASTGGTISSDRRFGSDKTAAAELVVRVPPKQLQQIVDKIGALGKETSRTLGAEDVSTTVADVNARVKALQISIDRLLALSKTAGTTADLLKIEEQVTQRQAELDSLKAQQTALNDQVSMATLSIHLAVTPTKTVVKKAGFSGNLSAGWDDLVGFGSALLSLLGRLLPWLAVVVILGIPAFIVWRRRTRAADVGAQLPAEAGPDNTGAEAEPATAQN